SDKVRDYDVSKTDGRGFFRSLKWADLTEVEKSVLRDHIYVNGIEKATKSELIQSLENDNNELSFYDNSYVALSPDQKFQAVMDIAFSGTVKTIEDLEALMDVPVPFLH